MDAARRRIARDVETDDDARHADADARVTRAHRVADASTTTTRVDAQSVVGIARRHEVKCGMSTLLRCGTVERRPDERALRRRVRRQRSVARGSSRRGVRVVRAEGGSFECGHFPACAGCANVTDPTTPEVLERAVEYFANVPSTSRTCGTTHTTFRGASTGWRCKAKLAVRTSPTAALALGLFRRGTHELEPIETCAVSHPAINDAARIVRDVCVDVGVEPYDEGDGSGELRYVQIVAYSETRGAWNVSTDVDASTCVALVWNAPVANGLTDRMRAVCEEIASRSHGRIRGMWVNLQNAKTNSIFDPVGWTHVLGERMTFLETPQNEQRVYYLPGSFMQANTEAYGELLKRLPSHVPKGSRVVEMFAGVGSIGYSLVTNENLDVRSVRFVESSSAVAEAWERTRDELPEEMRAKVSLRVAKAERVAEESTTDCDVLVVDPPRKGLDAKLRALLTSDSLSDDLQTLIYVSCDLNSFMRDADELMDSKKWRLAHHESFVFFPATNHIETFAVFSRR